MNRFVHKLFFSLLLLSATHVHAENSFVVSPSLGAASISNIAGYNNSPFLRIDGSHHPVPGFAVNVFGAGYSGFDASSSGNDLTVKVTGYGAGVTGRWPVHENATPYIRIEYMLWNAEARINDKLLAKDNGSSGGLAVGVQFPLTRQLGIKTEFARYNNVSGADIRQVSVGMTITLGRAANSVPKSHDMPSAGTD